MKYVAGVDIGTGSFKIVLMNGEGKTVVEHSVEYAYKATPDGGAEQSPQEWIDACTQCFSILKAAYGIDPLDIAAVCPTGMHRSLVLLDSDNNPIRDAIIWADIRCAPWVERITQDFGELVQQITRNRVITAQTLPRMLWLGETDPESMQRTKQFTYPSNYIAFWLTGVHAMDRNNASASSMYDMLSHDWSSELMGHFEIDASICPPLVETTDIHGTVTKEAAAQTGLKEGTPVVAGIGDASAEVYSLGMCTPDICRIRLGSAGDTSYVMDEKSMVKKPRDSILDYFPKGIYVNGDYILTCAQAVKWARGILWSGLPKKSDSYALMDREAEKTAPGAGGLLFHPFLLGENAPYYDPSLRAMFHGFSMSHERSHALRAIYEGLSFCFKNILDKSGQYKQFNTIYVVGGGTKSKLWLQTLTDVLGKETVLPKHCDAAYGAALLAGEAIGLWRTEKITAENRASETAIYPNPANTALYDEIFPRFRMIAETKL